jgi:hypothetical protein
MTVESLSYVYTSEDEISRLISAAGTNLRVGDLTSTMLTDYWTELIAEATDAVNQYVLWTYEAADLADNRWVRARATWIGLVLLCRRRGNAVPESIMQRYDEIIEELQMVLAGRLQIPRLNTISDMTPAMSNLEVDNRYRTRKLRVNPNISVGSITGQQDVSLESSYDWF